MGILAMLWHWLRKLVSKLRSLALPQPPQPEFTFVPGAPGEFAAQCDKFEGLYEALYRTSIAMPEAARCREVLSEWEIRLRYSGAVALQQTWRDSVRRATGLPEFGGGKAIDDASVIRLGKGWQELLCAWGMERDERMDFTYTDSEGERYWIEGNPEVTERFEVILSCWTREGTVIERGAVRRLGAGAEQANM